MYNINIIVYKLFIFIKVNYIWIVGYVVGILLGKFENGIQMMEEWKYMFKKLYVGINLCLMNVKCGYK